MSARLELYLENSAMALRRLPAAARLLNVALIYPRFYLQWVQARLGYMKYQNKYSQHTIFIAGLPKSGTTWLDQMVGALPGFHSMMLPGMLVASMRSGGSHDYELAPNAFATLKKALSVVKSHSHGSLHNVNVLKQAGIRYVIMYRDLRDVAVSYVHFVRERPWHPEYPMYANISLHDGLVQFADHLAVPYAEWVRSWNDNRDAGASMVVQYEQIHKDPLATFKQVLEHYDIDSSNEDIAAILSQYQLSRLKRGATHFRKGVTGDWKNHFTEDLREIYKEKIGRFLIDFGYERDMDWGEN